MRPRHGSSSRSCTPTCQCLTRVRGSTTTFFERGIGEVLIAWENEALMSIKQFGPDKFEPVAPSVSILAEPPVAVVDRIAVRHRTTELAKAYLEYLYTSEGQDVVVSQLLPPSRRRDHREVQVAVSEPCSLYGRRTVRRLDEGTEHLFCRQRRVRSGTAGREMTQAKQPRIAGFSPRAGLHAQIPAGDRRCSSFNDLLQVGDADLARILGDDRGATNLGRLAKLRGVIRRCAGEFRFRKAGGVDAGPLRGPRARRNRRDGRPAVRPADLGLLWP